MQYQITKHRIIIQTIILSFSTISVMCTGVIAPALPFIAKHYAYLPDAKFMVRLIITTPHLVIAFASPLIGWLLGRFNRKKIIIASVILYSISGSICFWLEDLYYVIASRALMGLTIAAILALSSTLIADCFDGKERSHIVALQTTFMSVGTITYSLIAGFLADFNWKYNFLLYLIPFTIVPFAMYFLIEPRTAVYNLNQPPDEHTIPNTQVIKQGNYTIFVIYMVSIVNMMMYYMIPLQLPFLLMTLPDMNAKKISLILAAETLSAAVFAMLYKSWKNNFDFSHLSAISFFIMASSYVIVSMTSNYYVILFAMIVYGCGMGIQMPNSSLWIIHVTKPHNRGLVIGGLFSAIYCGKFACSIMLNYLKGISMHSSYAIASTLMFCIVVLSLYLAYTKHKANINTVN